MAKEEQLAAWAADGRPPARDRLAKKRPATKVVPVYLEPDLVTAYNDAVAALESSRMLDADSASVAALEEAALLAKGRLDEETVELTLTALGRRQYDALLDAHQPSEEDAARHRELTGQDAAYDGDTFPPALVHASLSAAHGDEISLDDVRDWFDGWGGAELLGLFAAAMEVNTQRRVAGLGNG
jgi:hypothetical protein